MKKMLLLGLAIALISVYTVTPIENPSMESQQMSDPICC